MDRVTIVGHTYPVKDQLKALGGRWDAERRVWTVPADRAAEAQQIAAAATARVPSSATRQRYRTTRCASCGAVASRYVRIYGYTDRTAMCGGCYGDEREEREMGY